MHDKTWALQVGAKPPLDWTGAHEAVLRDADRLWDDLRALWIQARHEQEVLEDATGDAELIAARGRLARAESACDEAFGARREARQASRSREVPAEVEEAVEAACAERRAARRALAPVLRRVRREIRDELVDLWRWRDRRMQAIACGRSRRYPRLHHGVYNDVLRRFRVAGRETAKQGRVPRPAGAHPAQSLYLQVPGGVAWGRLAARRSDVFSLRPTDLGPRVSRDWRLLRIRVSADGLSLGLPVRVDREPPPEARVQAVRVVRRGRDWHAVVSLRAPVLTPIAGPMQPRTLYAGLNWRGMGDGSLRILGGLDDAGKRVDLHLDGETLAQARFADLLRSALDRRAREHAERVGALEDARYRRWEVLQDRAIQAGEGGAEGLAWALGTVRAGDRSLRGTALSEALHAARLSARRAARGDPEKHADLLVEAIGDVAGRRHEAGLRRKIVRRRDDLYRRGARWIAERYGRLVLAAADGSALARVEDPETGERTDLPLAARRARQVAAPYSLGEALRWAYTRSGGEVVEAPAHHTSHRCPVCGEEMERRPEDRRRLHLRCPEHGVWDRDYALALALLAADAGREGLDGHADPEERSRVEIVRVDAEVERMLRGHGEPRSRLRYVTGRPLARRPKT